MEIIQNISRAYRADNLMGSCCTRPMRTYTAWFQNKSEQSGNGYERTAWKVVHVITGLVAYPTLGVLALVGILINLCLTPPTENRIVSLENRVSSHHSEYSIFARLKGVPKGTEKFCEKIREKLSYACRSSAAKGDLCACLGSGCYSTDRQYTYRLGQQLIFDVQDVFDDVPLESNRRLIDGEEETILQPRKISSEYLARMEPHIVHIQDTVVALSKRFNWYPENQHMMILNERVIFVIPFPDHIPVPNLTTEFPRVVSSSVYTASTSSAPKGD